MSKKWFTAFIVAALFSTAGAFAQEKKEVPALQQQPKNKEVKKQEMYNKLDADKDGKISKDEADKGPKSKLSQNFAEIDKNKDNYLDKEELKAYRNEKKAAATTTPKKEK
jgi:Ca2+-binding EF-hand superfamily protein